LRIADCGLPIVDCRLSIDDCGLLIAEPPPRDAARHHPICNPDLNRNPRNPQSTIDSQQSAISNQQSAISNQQSAIVNRQLAICILQSAVCSANGLPFALRPAERDGAGKIRRARSSR
jgi:hypothetical protein